MFEKGYAVPELLTPALPPPPAGFRYQSAG